MLRLTVAHKTGSEVNFDLVESFIYIKNYHIFVINVQRSLNFSNNMMNIVADQVKNRLKPNINKFTMQSSLIMHDSLGSIYEVEKLIDPNQKMSEFSSGTVFIVPEARETENIEVVDGNEFKDLTIEWRYLNKKLFLLPAFVTHKTTLLNELIDVFTQKMHTIEAVNVFGKQQDMVDFYKKTISRLL